VPVEGGGKSGLALRPCGSTPASLGIADTQKRATTVGGSVTAVGVEQRREEKRFRLMQDVTVLEGTAAKVKDDFSLNPPMPKQGTPANDLPVPPSPANKIRVDTEGGGKQYLFHKNDIAFAEPLDRPVPANTP